MSESYTIVPLDQEVREWLVREGHTGVPNEDGRQATLAELKASLASIVGLSVEWSSGEVLLESAEGIQGELLIDGSGVRDSDTCEFYFRDGSDELVESIVTALARLVGPLVIVSHSGAFTKVAHAS